MLFQKYPPHERLKTYIKCYWTLSNSSPAVCDSRSYCFLNEGLEVFFNLNQSTQSEPCNRWSPTVHRSCVYGPMTQSIEIQGIGDLAAFGVCFRPGGAYPFIFCPVSELTNRQVETSDLLGIMGNRIINCIQYDCNTTKERIDFLDGVFLKQLEAGGEKNTAVEISLKAIDTFNGCLTIAELAILADKSRRQLERLFKKHIGLSPKQLCRNVRVKSLLKRLIISSTPLYSMTALDGGYYDQSHMIRDFKHYLGTSPAIYLEKERDDRILLT